MIIKTEDLTPQGRAARNRAVKRLAAALANKRAVAAKYDNWNYQPGGEADNAKHAAHNELNNALAPFSPQFGKYEFPEELREPSLVKGLI